MKPTVKAAVRKHRSAVVSPQKYTGLAVSGLYIPQQENRKQEAGETTQQMHVLHTLQNISIFKKCTWLTYTEQIHDSNAKFYPNTEQHFLLCVQYAIVQGQEDLGQTSDLTPQIQFKLTNCSCTFPNAVSCRVLKYLTLLCVLLTRSPLISCYVIFLQTIYVYKCTHTPIPGKTMLRYKETILI